MYNGVQFSTFTSGSSPGDSAGGGGVLEEPVVGRREETETQGGSRGSQRLDREEAGRALRLLCKPWSLAPHSKKRVGTRKALLFKRK